MPTVHSFLLGFALFCPAEGRPTNGPDLAQLREMLQDRHNPRGQNQAALLLVQSHDGEARKLVSQMLRGVDDPEAFFALAAAVRLTQDNRFLDELLLSLPSNRPGVRQAAAETLAVLTDPKLVTRLQAVVEDGHADLVVRQAALWTLARCGRQKAAAVLVDQLGSDQEALRRTAAEGLADLTGQTYGLDTAAWRAWWERHKDLAGERWLEQRLAYQASRARRLEGDLERARLQVQRLHQQLYARLPPADRLPFIQTLLDHDTPAVRSLAVGWAIELLAGPDSARQRALTQVLLKLSQDGSVEVQRQAVLGLGRINDPVVFERLQGLLEQAPPSVRAAAARALASQARGSGPDAQTRQKYVLPALQKALDDPSLEVVIEAAEDLGSLGALEAGPVLTGLLKHPSEPVRQTAAQALERVADANVLDGLLDSLEDPSCLVRISLIGAVARVVGNGNALGDDQREKLFNSLETLLLHDADAGVRGRAASVLGDCGPPAMLPVLWRCVLAAEDGRVQDKAWEALVSIVARGGDVELLREWDRNMTEARQGARRVQLVSEVAGRWLKRPEWKAQATSAQEILVTAQLDMGKWSTAGPLVRDLLSRAGTEAETTQRLGWLLTVGQMALKDDNRAEALKAAQDAKLYLSGTSGLTESFVKLIRDAGGMP
jgi:HEAT repeat protein